MEEIDPLWKSCRELTIVQIALILVGVDPAKNEVYIKSWNSEKRPQGYDIMLAALKNAVIAGTLPAIIKPDSINRTLPDCYNTIIRIEDLRQWLIKRDMRSGFFFQNEKPIEDFLSPEHPYYAPKLAAAYSAWLAVTTTPELLNGKTPKQAIKQWLNEHPSKFGLMQDDVAPSDNVIEEICKIVNWKPKGGVAATPTRVHSNLPTNSL
jgi:hypothetical protein